MSGWQMKGFLQFGAALLSCGFFTHAMAQNYPSKPVRILVGFAAGGGTDTAARMVAQKLFESLGQPVVVENRSGSGGIIATEAVAKAAPDGHTLLMMAAADSIQPAMRLKMPYELPKDFSPISLVVTGAFVLVIHPSVPARNVKELIAIARNRPGQLNYATSGIGSSAHLAAELMNSLAKIKTIHVPYKGVSQGVVGVASGEADMIFASVTAAQPLIDSGRLRPIAMSTAKRSALMPNMPTLHESGVPGYDRTGWYGMMGPAGLPRDVLTKLNASIVKAVNTPEMKAAFFKQGLEAETNTPEQFTEMIRREVEQNIKLARAAGIKPQ
ncbi:MAG: tripartite tricarboxylate transporter substrate binding protein [Betaproteobacteria bacterium]|nr:tripartite tricarboxylate transporter substrate binding protein [Betaproteobacteria bacterium]MBI2292493.1 tripartite tricarboxylate transporter substrate binding protein [Betaproteobacteria bacterium]MBI3053516.1 tripartite tricarboxylate transporter substrate binding protein [Betaproteobacteria bacterium]